MTNPEFEIFAPKLKNHSKTHTTRMQTTLNHHNQIQNNTSGALQRNLPCHHNLLE